MNGFTRIAGCVGRIGTMIVAGCLTPMIQVSGVHAGDCSPVRGSGSAETARLQRQIAANRAMELKYSCAAAATFACREIAGRIAQADARLASLSGASSQVCTKPVVAARVTVRRSAAARELTAGYTLPRISAKIETRCVRLSDGYSFPTPNSGYNTANDMEAIAAQCKFICDESAMDVYRITGADRSTDEMISVTTGARYAELPHAGAYRVAASLKTCDINRFYKAVLAKAPLEMTGTETTALNSEATLSAEGAVMNVALLGDVGLRGTSSVVPAPTRKIRIVGAAFLPEE
jgi:hypothetical protein